MNMSLTNMRMAGRTIGIVLRLAFLCAGAAFMTLRADGQNAPAPRDDAVTIEDDPTAVPDPKESADNNITFPVDI
jgi:hypothetical protein